LFFEYAGDFQDERKGDVSRAFVNAVESCGALLADHLPPRESAGNEIPAKIYLI